MDVIRSPVVEFNSCYFDDTVLRRGRVYYVDGFHDDKGHWVEKSAGFRTWAKAVLNSVKKTLMKHGSDYIGLEAAAWVKSGGGKLVT